MQDLIKRSRKIRWVITILDTQDKNSDEPWSFFSAGEDGLQGSNLVEDLKELDAYVRHHSVEEVKIKIDNR